MMFWETIKVTWLSCLRERTVLLWCIAFPLVLLTLFGLAFGNMDNLFETKPFGVVVVDDTNYENAPLLNSVLTGAKTDSGKPMLELTRVKNDTEAVAAIQNNMNLVGYISVDENGKSSLHLNPAEYQPESSADPVLLDSLLERYQAAAKLLAASSAEPSGSSGAGSAGTGSAAELQKLSSATDFTAPATAVYENAPSMLVRQFYAGIAFAMIMSIGIATEAMIRLQPTISPLGARRVMGAQSRGKTVAATLVSAWALTFAVNLVGYAYLHVWNIGYGVSLWPSLAVVLVGSIVMTLLGGLFGCFKSTTGTGIHAGVALGGSLLCGLFGTANQEMAASVAHNHPWTVWVNPVRQIFDGLNGYYVAGLGDTYYRSLLQLGICAVVLIIPIILMNRRTAHAHL
jgi:hypothetical protein